MHVLASASVDRPLRVPCAARAAPGLPLIVTTPSFAVLQEPRGALERHAILACECPAAATPPMVDGLSLRTMRCGTEVLKFGARRLVLDQDAFIVVNRDALRSSAYGGAAQVSPLLVVFRPGALAQCLAAPDTETGEAGVSADHFGFHETLQPHNAAVSHQLRLIERGVQDGDGDAGWWEERITLLLGAAVDAERVQRRAESKMIGLKAATRRELLRRVLMASDFIQSSYEQPITLSDIAVAAHLSPFHLVRLFRRAHGVTPHAYLTGKRVTVALRLVSQTQLSLDDIAVRSGLGTRSSLFRHLRRQQGSGASALRARGQSLAGPDACTTPA